MKNLFRAVLFTLALSLALSTATLAGLGEGVTVGRLTLRPYVDGSITYDSNALRVTDEEPVIDEEAIEGEIEVPADGELEEEEEPLKKESDNYFEVRGGTTFLWYGDSTLLTGSAWAFLRQYSKQDIEDEEGFGERVGLVGGDREKLAWSIFQSFERRSDFTLRSPEPITTEAGPDVVPPITAPGDEIDLEDELLRTRSERDLMSFGADIGHDLTEKLELDMGYGYGDVDYADEDLFSSTRQSGTASIGHKFTYKTTAFVSGTYGLDDNDGYVDAVSFYRFLFGLRSSASPKISYNIGVGYNNYETADYAPRVLDDGTIVFEDRSAILPDGTFVPSEPRRNPVTDEIIEEPERADELSGTAYDAGIDWRPTSKLLFSLAGRNGYDSTSNGTQRKLNLIQLSARHQTTDAISMTARISYRDEESPDEIILVDDVGIESRFKATREYLTAFARIGYRPRGKWYEVYADATYEDIESNRELQSYDRYRFGAGLRATY